MNPWNYLDGKKTVIAALAWPVVTILTVLEIIDGPTANKIIAGLSMWTGVALAHKALKVKR